MKDDQEFTQWGCIVVFVVIAICITAWEIAKLFKGAT